MIEYRDVKLELGGRAVLEGVSFVVPEGSITALVGASGSGKSTLLRLAIGLLYADAGQVLVEGEDVTRLTEKEWRIVRRKMGMVFQNSALFDSLTVLQNVGFYPHYVEHKPWREVHDLALELLHDLGMEQDADKLPDQLSGGMRRRVGLARSLIYRPKILLYDEPTTGLDPQNIEIVSELIAEMNERYKVTSVVVSHDLPCIQAVADHVVLLDVGRAVEIGPVEALLSSNDERVRRFTAPWRLQARPQ